MRAISGIVTTSALAISLLGISACGDPVSTAGKGTAVFTTWGEEYIEEGIAADPEGQTGFVDGWSVKYDKFLVIYTDIAVADSAGAVGASLDRPRFVDNTRPGKKELVTFKDLEAKAWDAVTYTIAPLGSGEDAAVVAGDPADLAMMVDKGYSIYVEGKATKSVGGAEAVKTFHWGFDTATRYVDCHSEVGGRDQLGVVVTRGGTDTSELTTHGDHFFYDRLKASPDSTIVTSLRFDAIADADADADGEISQSELWAKPIDVSLYDPSGFDAPNMGAFLGALARTIGHFRGEGECTVTRVEP